MQHRHIHRRAAIGKAALLASAMLTMSAMPAHAQDATATAEAEADAAVPGEIVVTATRKATVLSKTPVSIVAKGQEELDAQGVRSIADLASVTPGITFGQNSVAYGTGQTTIAIRGVDSQSGIPTTGVYIDDTPVQTRIGVSPSLGNAYPQVFDLERVEVLRGPQGTLFGSGSVGGAVRFIMPKPNYDALDVYARTELATTKHGAESYEAGLAVGAPIVEDKLAFRASAWGRRDGGYIDFYDPYTGDLRERDGNGSDSYSARLALGYKPSEMVTLTPSLFYQKDKIDDGSRFEVAASDLESGDLRNTLNRRPESHNARFYLPALKAEIDLGGATLTSDTSYFNRKTRTTGDDMSLSFVFTGGIIDRPFPDQFSDYAPFTVSNTKQTAFTQELRLQDNDQGDRLNWIVGAFYQKSYVRDQYAGSDVRMLELLNYGLEAAGEDPAPSLTDFFGAELYQDTFALFQRNTHRDKQYAVYGQADYEVIDNLKLTAGLRYTIAKYKYEGFAAGPVYGTEGQTDTLDTTSKTLTPKFGISYQATPANLFYASASKGVRGPGVSPPVGVNCADDAALIGIDENATINVAPDSIWSYELGTKNRLFNNRVSLEASIYRVDWKNVQTLFALPQCTIQTILNLGDAKIDGADVALTVRPVEGLTLGAMAAYTNARFTTAIPGPEDTIIRKKGEPFPLVAPWTVQLNGEYRHPASFGALYGRADFSYSSRIKDEVDQNSGFIDASLPRPPATSQLDLRVGGEVDMGNGVLDLSAFVNNVTNELPLVSLFHETPDSAFYRSGTFRPRTFGVTATFKR